MGLKKNIVKSLIVWPPVVVGAAFAFLGVAAAASTIDDTGSDRNSGLASAAIFIFTAACSVGNVVYIVKS